VKRKKKQKRVGQQKLWDAARFYCKEAEKATKARAYFCALVARGCELEALLRIFDMVETWYRKNRCRDMYSLINRAFARHWIPHDALRAWKKAEKIPLKQCLHEIREARNGVHAHLFDKTLFTRRTVNNVTYVVHSMYSFIEVKNARNFMKLLHEKGEISDADYSDWKKAQTRFSC
jgi:hypothetical protein